MSSEAAWPETRWRGDQEASHLLRPQRPHLQNGGWMGSPPKPLPPRAGPWGTTFATKRVIPERLEQVWAPVTHPPAQAHASRCPVLSAHLRGGS